MWSEGGSTTFREVKQDDLPDLAKILLEKAGTSAVWLFRGEMGSGKTTLIKHLCAEMGVVDPMSSPTFSIVNEYHGRGGKRIYHFDFYRIRNEEEAYDIGAEEYFYSGDLCLIEWPEKIPSLIPAEHAEVFIAAENPNQRTIALSVHDGKEEKRI